MIYHIFGPLRLEKPRFRLPAELGPRRRGHPVQINYGEDLKTIKKMRSLVVEVFAW